MNELRERLAYLWQSDIAAAYHAGRLVNQSTLLAELYRLLQDSGYPPCEAWLTPDLHFPPTTGVIFDQLDTFQVKQWLTHQRPSLLLTQEDEIVAALELDYTPDDFVDHRPGLRRLVSLAKLAGRERLHLRLDPQRGSLDAQHAFSFSPDLLCVYAIIAKRMPWPCAAKPCSTATPAKIFQPTSCT